jgi:hypothetical protein
MLFGRLSIAIPLIAITVCCGSCKPVATKGAIFSIPKIDVIFDTDANNEVDDQHALAYLLFNSSTFNIEGVTVNATYNGGSIDSHYREAETVMRLCGFAGKYPLIKGADKDFVDIKDGIGRSSFDGSEAVDFIIKKANNTRSQPLVIIAVGKLTNVALAVLKAPAISSKIRVVWLGSNFPDPGEYNQDNDTAAMNYLLDTDVPFEIVTVRYGKPSGTDAVKVSREDIIKNMTGRGPRIAPPVMGRHDAAFRTFGDYSVNLFEHIELYGNPPARSLFDMAAIAIIKNPDWANKRAFPAPTLTDNKWVERPSNNRRVWLWENFDRTSIMQDFFTTIAHYPSVTTK